MHIQWYPGHMTKAIRRMEEDVKLVDAIIYVLDSRAYKACFNPSFEKIGANKPRLYVLNKVDTIETSDMDRIVADLKSEGKVVVTTNSTTSRFARDVIVGLTNILQDKIEHFKSKGLRKTLRAMVIGVPNTGKSTLINSLCGSKRAITGNRPGVTRGKQWVSVSEYIDVLDTPGTLWPSFENQEYAKHLAYIGCIKDDVVGKEELCLEFIKDMMASRPDILENRYNISISADSLPIEIYESIAKSRGFILKGGDYDYDRTATAVLDDFRKQSMGKVALE